MKLFPRLALTALLPLCLLHADEPGTVAPAKTKFPFEESFSNLPKEKRDEFFADLKEAKRLYDQKRIFESLDESYKASKIFPEHPELKLVEGACYVEFRSFDKAMACFDKANALAPNQPMILFNIAELYYVTKDWEKAEPALVKVRDMVKNDKSQMQLERLVEFKILLCKLKLNKIDEAKKMAGNYDFHDDSPYTYYADAAIAFQEGREIDAETSLAQANRVFQGTTMVAPWQDTLIEFGYIKGFFGGDQGESTADQ